MAARKLLRSLSSLSIRSSPSSSCSLTSRLRPISALTSLNPGLASPVRNFSSDEPPSSPKFHLPKEPLYLPGCDYEHWLVVVDTPPPPPPPRQNIIKQYVQILATVVGSEEVAREKIYSVSTEHYFAFGALLSEELAYKLRDVDNVRFVLPDSYLDAENQDYGGEPLLKERQFHMIPNIMLCGCGGRKRKKVNSSTSPRHSSNSSKEGHNMWQAH